ncbi:tetratricopeptide repeat protein [Candidatus Desantisbacteria bacterium]|nr:tetratricopeptide repeat protein [Candidatus Desantisbacteria bacterium]
MLQKIVIAFLLLICLSSNLYATDPEIYYEQAQTAFQKEEYDYAAELFEKYLTFASEGEHAAEAWYSIGECQYKQENFPEALLSYQAVIDLYPDSSFVSKAYNKLGDCYWKIDDRDRARQSYEQTTKEYPNTPEAQYAQVCLTEMSSASKTQKTQPVSIKGIKGVQTIEKKGTETVEKSLGDELNTLEKAKALFKAKDYPGARVVFQDFLKAFPKSKYNHYARLKIAETYYYEENHSKALPEYKKVISDYPDSKYIDYALYSAGWCNFKLKGYAEAQKMFEALIKNYPQSNYVDPAKKILPKIADLIVEERLANLLNNAKENCEKGNLAAAKASMEQVIKEYPDSQSAKEAEPLLTQINQMLAEASYNEAKTAYDDAQKMLDEGKIEKAIKGFKEIISKYPESEFCDLSKSALKQATDTDKNVCATQAESRKQTTDEKSAVKKENVAAKKPSVPAAAVAVTNSETAKSAGRVNTQPEGYGYIAAVDNEIDKSTDLYKKALEYLGNEDYSHAIETFQRIILEYPESSYATLAKTGMDEASSSLKAQRIERLFEIAQRYYNLGEYEKAKQGFKNITDEYPETNQAQKAQEMIHQLSGVSAERVSEEYVSAQRSYEQGDLIRALEQFNSLVKKYPQTIYAQAAEGTIAIIQEKLSNKKAKGLYEEARSLQEQGNYTEAIDEYTKMLEEYPKAYWTPYAQYSKAETFYSQQKYKEAIAAWQKVIDNFPGSDMSPHSLYHIAECYEKLKDYKNASQSYLKLQQVYPESIYSRGELSELIKKQAAKLKGMGEK